MTFTLTDAKLCCKYYVVFYAKIILPFIFRFLAISLAIIFRPNCVHMALFHVSVKDKVSLPEKHDKLE